MLGREVSVCLAVELLQLPEFFRQRHLREQLIDSTLDCGPAALRKSCGAEKMRSRWLRSILLLLAACVLKRVPLGRLKNYLCQHRKMIRCPKPVPPIGKRSVLQHTRIPSRTKMWSMVLPGSSSLNELKVESPPKCPFAARVSCIRHVAVSRCRPSSLVRRTVFLNIQIASKNEWREIRRSLRSFSGSESALCPGTVAAMIEVSVEMKKDFLRDTILKFCPRNDPRIRRVPTCCRRVGSFGKPKCFGSRSWNRDRDR